MSTQEFIVEQATDVVTAESTTANAIEPAEVTEQQGTTGSTEEIESAEHEETETTGAAPSGAEKRIKQLAAQRKSEQEARIRAEVEREYYKGLAEGRATPQPVEQPQVPTQQPNIPPPEPILDAFETYEEYERARTEYYIQLAEHRMLQRIQQQQMQVVQQQKATEATQKLETAAKEDPVFAEIWKNKALWDTLPISAPMAEVITASPISAEVIKWVHANRDAARQIAAMPPLLAAREIAMVEAAIKSAPRPAPPKRVSAAPEPIATINPALSNVVDEDDLPMDEYYRRRTKQIYGR